MNLVMSLAFIAAGIYALSRSILGKEFRRTDAATGQLDLGTMPGWAGKLLFTIVGLGLLSAGIYHLFRA